MQNNKTASERRAQMLIYAAPNFFLTIFGIAWAVKELGWSSLIGFPYVILLLWLLFSIVIVVYLKWHEAEKETIEDKLDKIIELLGGNDNDNSQRK